MGTLNVLQELEAAAEVRALHVKECTAKNDGRRMRKTK